MKYYTERISKHLNKSNVCKHLGIKLGPFATYGKLLEKIKESGYWIELTPFYTFALKDNVAFMLKIWKLDNDNARWKCIYDENTMYENGGGYGSSFYYAIHLAILKIQKDINNTKN